MRNKLGARKLRSLESNPYSLVSPAAAWSTFSQEITRRQDPGEIIRRIIFPATTTCGASKFVAGGIITMHRPR